MIVLAVSSLVETDWAFATGASFPAVTTRVAGPGAGLFPWQPAPLFVPVTVKANVPVGEEAVVATLRLVVAFAPVVVTEVGANVAVAPVGSPEAAKVTVH